MDKITLMAMKMYTVYCQGVGGKAYNGDLLPTANQFFDDPEKQVQARAWKEAAKAAKEFIFDEF